MVKLRHLSATLDLNETQDEELIRNIQTNLIRTNYLFNTPAIDIDGIVDSDTMSNCAKFKPDKFMTDANLIASGMLTNGIEWISSPFGIRGGVFHQGIDIAAPSGTPVYAVANGKVIYIVTGCRVGNYRCGGDYGNVIYLQHSGQPYDETRYAHLSSVSVTCGQIVSQGQQIGTVGSTGNSTEPHLHFETRIRGSAKNPLNFINPIV